MKSERLVKWTLSNGSNIEAKIEVERAMEDDIAYSDGWNMNLGKKPVETMKISVYIDSKFTTDTYNKPVAVVTGNFNTEYANKITKMGGYALLANKIVLKENVYNDIMNAIEEAISEAEQDEEYKVYKENKTIEDNKKKETEEARLTELKETKIPEMAIKAYKHYKGNAEAAWEDENETAWALIKKWKPYIIAQNI